MAKRWIDMDKSEKAKFKSHCYFNRDRTEERSRLKADACKIESEAEYTLMFLDVYNRYVIPEKLA